MADLISEQRVWPDLPIPSEVARVVVVDDHPVVAAGLASLLADPGDLVLVGAAATVPALLATGVQFDLALLGLRLGDGSAPRDNIRQLADCGVPVIAYTSGEFPALVLEAARAGVVGVIRKSEPTDVLLSGIRAALRGEVVATSSWLAALHADAPATHPRLTPREQQVLTIYASGEKADRVARALGVPRETVLDHLKSIRAKYAAAHRPAPTKVHLYRRAVEDGLLPPWP